MTPAEGGHASDSTGSAGTLASGGTNSAGDGDSIDAGAPGNGGNSSEPATGGSSSGGRGSNASGGSAAMAGSAGALPSAGSGGSGASGASGSVGAAGAPSELALAKPSTASSVQSANPCSSGNDGQTTTRFSANSGTLPQWWRVDLGATHSLTEVAIQFEFPDRKYTYAVETSLDDSTYTSQANVVGVGTVQTVSIPNNAAARYVRITCTAAAPGVDSSGASHPTWMSFWEVSVRGN